MMQGAGGKAPFQDFAPNALVLIDDGPSRRRRCRLGRSGGGGRRMNVADGRSCGPCDGRVVVRLLPRFDVNLARRRGQTVDGRYFGGPRRRTSCLLFKAGPSISGMTRQHVDHILSTGLTCRLRVVVGVAANAGGGQDVADSIPDGRAEEPAEERVPNAEAEETPGDDKVQPRRHLVNQNNIYTMRPLQRGGENQKEKDSSYVVAETGDDDLLDDPRRRVDDEGQRHGRHRSGDGFFHFHLHLFFFSFLCGEDARNRVSLVITIIITSRLRTLQYPSVQ